MAMADGLSAGWREVFRACHVDVPMTPQREPPLRERPQSGTNTTMSELEQSERELHNHAKWRIGFVVRDL